MASEGSLFVHWSAEPVPGALAYFRPHKPVPAFKFKQHGGRAEIIRGFKGSGKPRFFEGVCQYGKLCRDLDGEFTLLTPSIRAYFILPEGQVFEIAPGISTSLSPASAMSVVAPNNTCFEGVGVLSPAFFRGTGTKEGFGLSFV